MTDGFALHEIICTDKGKPCDYLFLDINPAFERLTGLKREEVVDRTVSEVLPDNDTYWVEIYGKVALTVSQYTSRTMPRLSTCTTKYLHIVRHHASSRQYSRHHHAQAGREATFRDNQRLQALMQAVPVVLAFSDDTTCRRITGNLAVLEQFEINQEDNLSASAPDDHASGRQ